MMVVGGQSTEELLKLCEDGKKFGLKRLYYAFQQGEGGIAAALSLTEEFVGNDDCCVVLGDNLLLDDSLEGYKKVFQTRDREKHGALVLLKEVPDPENYGIAYITHDPNNPDDKKLKGIIEKPGVKSLSNLAVTGMYFYDHTVFDRIRTCHPSGRHELEITDVNMSYLVEGKLGWTILYGQWLDAGASISALNKASRAVEEWSTRTATLEPYPELVMKP